MDRYNRHSEIFGNNKFQQIKNAEVLVAGAGGLGCTVLNLLARMGVGKIHFFENAIIDLPDLNRQILYTTSDVKKLKSQIAFERFKEINPEIEIIAHNERIAESTEIPSVDIVFDCLDNFSSRYIVAEKIYNADIPLVHAGVSNFCGQITFVWRKKTARLQDIITVEPKQFDSQIEKTIFPPVVTTLASLQVAEGIKYLLGNHTNLLINKILIVDLFSNSFHTIDINI